MKHLDQEKKKAYIEIHFFIERERKRERERERERERDSSVLNKMVHVF